MKAKHCNGFLLQDVFFLWIKLWMVRSLDNHSLAVHSPMTVFYIYQWDGKTKEVVLMNESSKHC